MHAFPRFKHVLVLAMCSLLWGAGVAAANPMQWGADVFGGFNTHSMSDWNDIIDQANSSGSNFDNIHSGFSFGAGPTMTTGQWMWGADFERLMAKTSSYQGTDVEPSANAFGVSVGYMIPSTGPMSWALKANVDWLTLTGDIHSSTSTPSTADTHGSGAGFQFLGVGTHSFTPAISGMLQLGYRFADVKIKDIAGQDVSSSGLTHEDYSGLVARVGFNFHQPMTSAMHTMSSTMHHHHTTTTSSN